MFPLCSDYICYNLNDEKEVLQSEYQQIFKKKTLLVHLEEWLLLICSRL